MKNVNAFVRIESHARCLKRLRKEKESQSILDQIYDSKDTK